MLIIWTLVKFAVIAQSVEQLTRNEQVVRSIRINGSTMEQALGLFPRCLFCVYVIGSTLKDPDTNGFRESLN